MEDSDTFYPNKPIEAISVADIIESLNRLTKADQIKVRDHLTSTIEDNSIQIHSMTVKQWLNHIGMFLYVHMTPRDRYVFMKIKGALDDISPDVLIDSFYKENALRFLPGIGAETVNFFNKLYFESISFRNHLNNNEYNSTPNDTGNDEYFTKNQIAEIYIISRTTIDARIKDGTFLWLRGEDGTVRISGKSVESSKYKRKLNLFYETKQNPPQLLHRRYALATDMRKGQSGKAISRRTD